MALGDRPNRTDPSTGLPVQGQAATNQAIRYMAPKPGVEGTVTTPNLGGGHVATGRGPGPGAPDARYDPPAIPHPPLSLPETGRGNLETGMNGTPMRAGNQVTRFNTATGAAAGAETRRQVREVVRRNGGKPFDGG